MGHRASIALLAAASLLGCVDLTGANTTHTAAYVAEASQFQANGIPAVICGPGNIDQAHQANEWIAVDQLDQCAQFLRRLLAWAESGAPVP